MTKRFIYLIIVCIGFVLLYENPVYAQIDDIKKKSDDNKSNGNNNSSNSNSDGGSEGGIFESCAAGCMSGCVDVGCNFFSGFVAEYSANVATFRETNPSILSFEANVDVAPAYHFTSNEKFSYMIYLPAIRGHLASFMLEFRFNLLTEFSNDLPNSFRCWDFIAGFNIVPSDKFKLTLGTGVQREMYNEMYFHEYYLGSRIWFSQICDYLDIDYRLSADYETGVFPFQEAGIRYNLRIMNFDHLFSHLSLGMMYQNYYQSHDIWALRAGIVFNLH